MIPHRIKPGDYVSVTSPDYVLVHILVDGVVVRSQWLTAGYVYRLAYPQ